MEDRSGIGGGKKRPRLKQAVMVDTVRGKTRLRKWPRPRPTRTDAQKDRENTFAEIQRAFRFTEPKLQQVFYEATEGSPFLPRDLYTQGNYGRLFQLIIGDEPEIISSMAQRRDVSDSLDTLGTMAGSLIVKGDPLWRALPPGTTGQVLIAQGPDAEPLWQDPVNLPNPRIYSPACEGSVQGVNESLSGNLFVIQQAVAIYGLRVMAEVDSANAKYRAYVAKIDGTFKVTDLWQSAEYSVSGATRQIVPLDLETPATLQSGDLVAFLFNRTDATAATNSRIWVKNDGGGVNAPLPAFSCRHSTRRVRMTKIGLAVGDTINTEVSLGLFCIGILHTS